MEDIDLGGVVDQAATKRLRRRNDRFYYYCAIPWATEAPSLARSRYTMLVDLLGVDIRISFTQSVYIATMQEAFDFERIFGPVTRPCDCKQGNVSFSGAQLLYGTCSSSGISASEFFQRFDRSYEKRFGRQPGSRPKYYPDVPAELLVDIDWGDVHRKSADYMLSGKPQLWGFDLNDEPALRVWQVDHYVLETTLLVLAEEPDWQKRLEFYRDHRRSVSGIEVIRKECGLPTLHPPTEGAR